MRRLIVIPMALLLGCGWNYTPTDNVLPSPNAEGESSSSGPMLPDIGDTDGAELAPATFRFDCIDIKKLGDADPSVFQVATLQSTWAGDIAGFRLNVLIDLLTLDEAGGSGTVTVRSGIGSGWSDQCSQNQTESNEFMVAYDPALTVWVPSQAEGECAMMASSGGGGTFSLDLGGTDRVFIYAEQDDHTAFNCSLDAQRPDAIPIYGVSSTITTTDDYTAIAGTLTGCMKRSDAEQTCSCLSVCSGNQHPDCPGCPGGAVPLGLLLGGINSTQHCTDLVGEEAYDIELQFTARRLAAVPTSCP